MLLILVVGFVVAGCARDPGFTASVISTLNTVGTGEQRVLIELSDAEGDPLVVDSVPDATLRNEDGSPLGVYPGDLVWIVPDEVPAYAFVMDIPEPETYQVTVGVGGSGETPPAGFVAVADPLQVEAGEAVPDIDGEEVSGPALVVFASPEWCPSRSCQPMIDQAVAAASGSGASFTQVEVFANPEAGAEEELTLAPVVEDWGLPSQPWLYVVEPGGVVAALFEGAVSDRELERALESMTG
jgi:hypothetical protein